MRAGNRWRPSTVGGVRLRRGFRWTGRWPRMALTVSVLAALSIAGWWVDGSSLLALRKVTVEGVHVVSPETVRIIADLEGRPMLHPGFDDARQRLLTLPQVKDVRISHAWPAGAKITIFERQPWGIWQLGEARYVIDSEGVVLDLQAPDGAPVIVQTDAGRSLAPNDRVDAGALAAARQLVPMAERTLGRSIVGLEFSQASGLIVVLDGGLDGFELRATFGDAQGYDFKVATLYTLIRLAEEEGRTLEKVDLRFGNMVAVQ